jgi:hypothetical protein
MPLHDWSTLDNWETVHHLWITELLRWIKPRLPPEYRVYIGNLPMLGIGGPSGRPDVGLRRWPGEVPPINVPEESEAGSIPGQDERPAFEFGVAALGYSPKLFVECRGFLVAALEVISPRNKGRPSSRSILCNRFAGYLLQGIHLLLIDVHRHPLNFSFPDSIAAELQFEQAPCPAPCAVSYRVGEPAANGGRLLAGWPRTLTIGAPLPTVVLPLNVHQSVSVDLERTYARAAAGAYLE